MAVLEMNRFQAVGYLIAAMKAEGVYEAMDIAALVDQFLMQVNQLTPEQAGQLYFYGEVLPDRELTEAEIDENFRMAKANVEIDCGPISPAAEQLIKSRLRGEISEREFNRRLMVLTYAEASSERDGVYVWLDPDDPESENQQRFVRVYLEEHYGPDIREWHEASAEALRVYWQARGYYTDPEKDAFILPQEP